MLMVEFHATPRKPVLLSDGQLYDVIACMYATDGIFYAVKSGESDIELVSRQRFHPEVTLLYVFQEFDFYPGSIITCDQLKGESGKVVACLFSDTERAQHEYIIESQKTGERFLTASYELSRHSDPGQIDLLSKNSSELLAELHSTLSV